MDPAEYILSALPSLKHSNVFLSHLPSFNSIFITNLPYKITVQKLYNKDKNDSKIGGYFRFSKVTFILKLPY